MTCDYYAGPPKADACWTCGGKWLPHFPKAAPPRPSKPTKPARGKRGNERNLRNHTTSDELARYWAEKESP